MENIELRTKVTSYSDICRPQGANTFGGNDAAFASLNPIKQSSGMNDDTAFSSLNPIQQSNGVNPSSAAPQSYSLTGGNPFG